MDAFGTSNKKNQLLREEAEPDEKIKNQLREAELR